MILFPRNGVKTGLVVIQKMAGDGEDDTIKNWRETGYFSLLPCLFLSSQV